MFTKTIQAAGADDARVPGAGLSKGVSCDLGHGRSQVARLTLLPIAASWQLFTQAIDLDSDHTLSSPDGLISDINVKDYQQAIDELLQASRCVATCSCSLAKLTDAFHL